MKLESVGDDSLLELELLELECVQVHSDCSELVFFKTQTLSLVQQVLFQWQNTPFQL